MFKLDKLLHFLASFFLTSVFGLWSIPMSIVITFIIGLGKEVIYDYLLKRGEFDLKDILANCAGILTYYIMYGA